MSSFNLVKMKFVDIPQNSICESYTLIDTYQKTGSTEEDFIVVKKPKLIERFDIKERVLSECKNNNLSALYNLYVTTGDLSVFNQRNNVKYGNSVDLSPNLGAVLDKKVETERILEKASIKDVELAKTLSNMNKSEFDDYISSLIEKRFGKPKTGEIKAVNNIKEE